MKNDSFVLNDFNKMCVYYFSCIQAARRSGVPVILDAGGVDAPIPLELLQFIDILSPNETELARLTNMPTESFEQISQAAGKCHEMVGGI